MNPKTDPLNLEIMDLRTTGSEAKPYYCPILKINTNQKGQGMEQPRALQILDPPQIGYPDKINLRG